MSGNEALDPPHGFGDDARSRRLRAKPAPESLAWVESSLGARVVAARARKGGSSSAIHDLRLESPATGARTTVVLRQYVIRKVIVEEPDLVEREAKAFALLRGIDLPTPELLAADVDGTACGVASVVMSRLPGRVDWFPRDLKPWLHRLADVLPPLHDAPVPADHGLHRFFPYEPTSWDRPVWLRDPSLWDRAVRAFYEPPVDDTQVLIHRDYHPGNVLWSRRRVSGVVDWPVACIGPPSVDAFWCAANLLSRFGAEVAERFLGIWERRSGRTYHPWGEVVLLVDILGSGHERATAERVAYEDRLARGLAALGL